MAGQVVTGAIDPGSIRKHRGIIVERKVRFHHEIVAVIGNTVMIHATKQDEKTGEILAETTWELQPGMSFDAHGVWEKLMLDD